MGKKNSSTFLLKFFYLLSFFSATIFISFIYLTPIQAQRKIISLDGSSTVFPLAEAAAEEFQTLKKSLIQVTVGISGTGGGFKRFCRGDIDIQNASRPILTNEIEICKTNKIKYIELPLAFDALAIVVNPQNTSAQDITVEELKKIWEPQAQNKIKLWSQIRPSWPDTPINLYGPGPDSGTFDYFTEAIMGKSKSSRGDFTASEDDNTIVQGVSRDKGGLGYFGLAYYDSNKSKLKLLPVKSSKKPQAILPNSETVKNGSYFPLSRPIFIYISETSIKNKPELTEFVEFFIKESETLAKEVKYIPLPKEAYTKALERFKNKQWGSVFKGHSDVGLTIEELLKRAPQ